MGARGSINCLRYFLNFSPSDNELLQPSAKETCAREAQGFTSGAFGLLSVKTTTESCDVDAGVIS